MTRKLILDVDTGTDDAVAIMFAALHSELDLVGVTTVHGNVPLQYTTDNTLRVLDFIGRSDVPVHPGLARPIARLDVPKRYALDSPGDRHGTELPIPPPHSKPSQVGAVEYLVETFRSATDEITLVAVGPLSNVAAALAIEPTLVHAVPELVIMGGGRHVGNHTASADFNLQADPEAAAMVFAAGFRDVTLIPLQATHKALVTREDCGRFAAWGTPAGIAADRFVRRRMDAGRNEHAVAETNAAPVHDAVCTAYLVDPDVVTTRHAHVAVETTGELTLGYAVVDLCADADADAEDEPHCRVAVDADARRFVELLATVFSGGCATPRSDARRSSSRGMW